MKSTVSVRDKLKKRREALGSILSGISTTAAANVETSKAETDGKKKESESSSSDKKQTGSKGDSAHSIEDNQPAEKRMKLSKDQRWGDFRYIFCSNFFEKSLQNASSKNCLQTVKQYFLIFKVWYVYLLHCISLIN